MTSIVYSKYKLTVTERKTLNKGLEDITYTCGAKLTDRNVIGHFDEEIAAIRKIRCWFISTYNNYVFIVEVTKPRDKGGLLPTVYRL